MACEGGVGTREGAGDKKVGPHLSYGSTAGIWVPCNVSKQHCKV